MSHHHISRRKFLGQASCATVGYTTLLSTLCNLKAVNAATRFNSSTVAGGDYKALVCLMLSGGNDSFNMLIPRGSAEYNEYATTRSNLAIPRGEILPISPVTSDGKQYGLHPSIPEMQNLFNSGRLGFIANIGSLIEPVTKTQFYNGTARLPLGLYSHADQIMHWQTGVPHERVAQGWGGKIADMIHQANSNQDISMNISLSGSNVYQTGNTTVEYAIDPYNGSTGIYGYGEPWAFNEMRTAAIDNMVDQNYQNVFQRSYVDVIKTAVRGHGQFSTAIDAVNPFTTQFSDTYLSESFKMVAKVIAAREALGMSRQIFFIDYGGWDHHDEVLNNQAEMLTEVSRALGEFNSVMDEINMSDCVTTFSISEFGRTLTSNGNGTDHAWGGNVFMMGGAVNGQEIYGAYPSLELDNELELGGGSLIPTTSADEYFTELSMWFGVSNTDLPIIFPNIGNFYSVGSANNPIGFMRM